MADDVKDRGIEALIAAAQEGDVSQVSELVGQGVPIDARGHPPVNESGRSALDKAIWANHVEVVTRLLELGADPEQIIGPHNETFPLRFAATRDLVGIADALIRFGARMDGQPRPDLPGTLLTLAASNASMDMVALLLDSGLDVNGPDFPLNSAVAGGHLPMIRFLLQRGARADAYHIVMLTDQMNRPDVDEYQRAEFHEVIDLIRKAPKRQKDNPA